MTNNHEIFIDKLHMNLVTSDDYVFKDNFIESTIDSIGISYISLPINGKIIKLPDSTTISRNRGIVISSFEISNDEITIVFYKMKNDYMPGYWTTEYIGWHLNYEKYIMFTVNFRNVEHKKVEDFIRLVFNNISDIS